MKKIDLHIGDQIQGDFVKKELNLLLSFQVNCPGCFIYALPLFNKLFHDFNSSKFSFLALSTAFEDFDKNTLPNTEGLITSGLLVGETLKALSQQGYQSLPYSLDFPIAMDKLEDNLVDIEYAIEKICNINPNYFLWPEFEKKALQQRVANYLNSLDKVALTFTLNQFRGTPTFVLFNSENEILEEWFGHVEYDTIAKKISQFN